jgi:hypothetical protein
LNDSIIVNFLSFSLIALVTTPKLTVAPRGRAASNGADWNQNPLTSYRP